jgi:hypothetical protein
MKRSLADGAGYLEIDHRDSPGLTPQDVAHVPGAVAVPGGAQHKADVMMCSHCQRGVLLNPGRVRARAVCPKCYHFICDRCEAIRVAAGGACVPFKAVIEQAVEIAQKYAGQPDHPDAVIDADALMQPSTASSIVITDLPS